MKIGIYSEPAGATLGGAEYTVAVLGEALAKRHQVDIIHHRPELTSALLAKTFALKLDGVRLRRVPYDSAHRPKGGRGWRSFYRLKSWHADLSQPYDLFINFTHGIPPFCHARFGILAILFPIFQPFNAWPWLEAAPHRPSLLPKQFHRSYFENHWRKRLRSYHKTLAISQFARSWTKRRWQVDCGVLYPPVETRFATAEKTNLILSVGRFTAADIKKNQVELAMVFRKMVEAGRRDWQFACAGSLRETVTDRNYFDQVRRFAPPQLSHLLANVERAELTRLYERAKIFWHAAGYGQDDASRPESMEHFGIATVEAMAAGCVPVVIDKGGQSEVIEHGVTGFLWSTLDELAGYTQRLMEDDALRARMSIAARARSQAFDRDLFVARFEELIKPFLI